MNRSETCFDATQAECSRPKVGSRISLSTSMYCTQSARSNVSPLGLASHPDSLVADALLDVMILFLRANYLLFIYHDNRTSSRGGYQTSLAQSPAPRAITHGSSSSRRRRKGKNERRTFANHPRRCPDRTLEIPPEGRSDGVVGTLSRATYFRTRAWCCLNDSSHARYFVRLFRK